MFQKGQSGNPGGRKKALITIELEKIAKMELPSGKTKAQLLAEVMFDKALEGEPTAYKYVTDRIDGTHVQVVDQTVEGEIGVIAIGKPDFVKADDN